LSYSNYTFSNTGLSHGGQVSLAADSGFNVSLDITNTGKMDGKIVVQVYFSQDLASRVRFSKMLLGECRHEILRDDNDKHEHSLFLFQNKIVYRVSCIISHQLTDTLSDGARLPRAQGLAKCSSRPVRPSRA